MSKITRKHGWPVALMLALGIVGVLAAFVALTASPGGALAQDPTPPTDPGAGAGTPAPSPTADPRCETPIGAFLPACMTPTPAPTAVPGETPAPTAGPTGTPGPTPTPAPEAPDKVGEIPTQELEGGRETKVIDLSDFFSDPPQGVVRTYEARSSDTDIATVRIVGDNLIIARALTPNAEGTVTIMVWALNGESRSEAHTFTAVVPLRSADLYDIEAISSRLLDGTDDDRVSLIRRNLAIFDSEEVIEVEPSPTGEFGKLRLHTLRVTASDALTEDVRVNILYKESSTGLFGGLIGPAPVSDPIPLYPGEFQKGLLTVSATDENRQRDMTVHVTCQEVGDQVEIFVRDERLTLVAKAVIRCVAPEGPAPTVVQPDCYQIVADRDASYPAAQNPQDRWWSVRDQWWDDERNPATGLRTAEQGRYTIQALVNEPHLQLTVTACEEGPVYLRFLDSNMESFGADIDEVEANAGADIVGLDSQGKLELNIGGDSGAGPNYGPVAPAQRNAAWAHWYDHFTVTRTTNAAGQVIETLAGTPGIYYQGKFRFFTPCPTADHQFTVQVYEKEGKHLRTQETISCGVDPLQPSALSVTTDSDVAGQAVLRWRPVPNADAHLVVVIDSAARSVVYTATTAGNGMADHTGTTITGLVNGKQYAFAVLAQRGQGSTATYTVALITQTMSWSN